MEHLLIRLILVYLAVINLTGFISMFLDKRKARRGDWRISERTLLLFAVLGGSIGSLAGMLLFRHKTKHAKFKIGIPVILIIQVCLLLFAATTAARAYAAPSAVTARQLDKLTQGGAVEQFLQPLLQLTGDTDLQQSETDTDSALVQETVALFYNNFSYKILSSAISDETAEVSAQLTILDTHTLAQDICLALTARKMQASDDEAQSVLSFTDILTLLRDTLSSHSYDMIQETVVFHLQKTAGVWEIDTDDAYVDAMSGNFSRYIRDPDLLDPEQILSVYLTYYQELSPSEWAAAVGRSDLFGTGSNSYAGELDQQYYKKLSDTLRITITTETQDEDTRPDTLSVPVEITTISMPSIMQNYREKLLQYAGTVDSITAGRETLDDTAASLLADCLRENTDTITLHTVIVMQHDGSGWYPEITEELINLFMGDLSGALDTIQNDQEDFSAS